MSKKFVMSISILVPRGGAPFGQHQVAILDQVAILGADQKERGLWGPEWSMVVTRMNTPKYGETLKFAYLKYQPIFVKSYQRFKPVCTSYLFMCHEVSQHILEYPF